MAEALAKKVLLIGWDAADWKVATPLMDQGLMPTLEDFVGHGVMGNLATLRPILSPMLWNSIVTGMRADKHGILGFIEPDTQRGGVRPVSSTSRKVKAVWNILTQKGYKTHVLGWFAGHPAEPINGIAISDLYPYAQAPLDKPWPLAPGSVHPESLRDTFAELRMHPAELTAAAIVPWIPQAAKIDQEKDKRLASFVQILAENLSIHNAATWILQNRPWDFMAVYYNGIDHFSHGFMHFHPPRMEGVPEDLFEIYKDVVNNAYRFHDMMLHTLLQLAGPETTVLLVSDHGFHSDHLRPRGIPNEPAGPAVQHRPFGIIVMKGPHVKQDERIYGATLLDVAPTILALFGLPVGEDMDGRVLVQAFESPPPQTVGAGLGPGLGPALAGTATTAAPQGKGQAQGLPLRSEVERIPSWEAVPGPCGMHPAELRMDPATAQAALQQFAALGYIEQPNQNQQKALEISVRESKYNLARVYLDSRRPREALPILEELARGSDEARFRQHLAQCHYMLGRRAEARKVLDDLIANPPKPPISPTVEEANGEGGEPVETHPESPGGGQPGLRPPLLNQQGTVTRAAQERVGETTEAAPASPTPWADWLMGVIHLEEGNPDEALACLLRAEQADPRLPDLYLRIGEVYLLMKRLEDAERAFRRALEIDGDSAEAHHGLARVHLWRRRNEAAAEEALIAVGLQHFLPWGHFHLGVALARLGHPYRATLAFETSLTMAPGLVPAHRWLAALYGRPGGDLPRAAQHRRLLTELRQKRDAQQVA
jgi:predicted AlkP superfamily phosphohydrolase/phosphomutase/tetratricopeptide (TPR) repeat protein